jgi:predicted transcriptional regulator YheO
MGEVIDFLQKRCAASEEALLHVLAEEWQRLAATVNVKNAKRRLGKLAAHLELGKMMLVGRLKKTASMQFAKLPSHTAFPRIFEP